ncbi:nitroreductase/quinone reductase family protein [Microlunatus parietis]|uniref:Deazaflavin-dependent oxidoreductase (Nitroreductase family) n=1 Tax=Microlunatus parietis TaxID=682979 RepID=A0A7Y9L980_9ACTN|nr:nitroreductase/quinone reductase family protein [Microlunatus parietis]NYE71519.1 deazaflavin-dependent oxidoreductase (nitroreductase family) [Microlunatus parietis]
MTAAQTYYREPGWITKRIFNPLIAGLTRLGISVWGSRVLEVRGRTSGEPRQVPVNLLRYEGEAYLVAPRGQAQWVRNVRADGGRLDLLLGKRREHWLAVELDDEEKLPVLKAYLRKWKAEVGVFFDGVDADSPESELRRIAPRHPAFRLERRRG